MHSTVQRLLYDTVHCLECIECIIGPANSMSAVCAGVEDGAERLCKAWVAAVHSGVCQS